TTRGLEQTIPRQRAFDLMRRDLLAAVPPSGGMLGDFHAGAASLGLGSAQSGASGNGLDFCTASAVINATDPWGEVQPVSYQLRDPVVRTGGPGKDLIRSVNRNLLPTTSDEPVDQWLLGNVESLEVLCYDGSSWRNTWDTSMSDTNLPAAVRIRLLMADN